MTELMTRNENVARKITGMITQESFSRKLNISDVMGELDFLRQMGGVTTDGLQIKQNPDLSLEFTLAVDVRKEVIRQIVDLLSIIATRIEIVGAKKISPELESLMELGDFRSLMTSFSINEITPRLFGFYKGLVTRGFGYELTGDFQPNMSPDFKIGLLQAIQGAIEFQEEMYEMEKIEAGKIRQTIGEEGMMLIDKLCKLGV
jgi:hypothetical protein